jgi:HD-like signal output (HDOD) protein
MTAPAATQKPATPSSAADSAREAFEFVKALATELSEGKIELPSFPDIATRVQRVLGDEKSTPDRVVRVVGSEPALAARLVGMANSAALNTTGKPVTELRTAIARLGFDMVRSAAMSFAMSQLRKAEEFRSLEKPMNLLWHRSVSVAVLSYVIAKRLTRLQADSALLAGLLHGVGRLYILTRASRHPALFADPAAYNTIVRDWHANIARAVLENWAMADEIVEAVHGYEDLERDARGGQLGLTDVLAVASLMASFRDQPDLLEARLQEFKPAARIASDRAVLTQLFQDSAAEMAALRDALGD